MKVEKTLPISEAPRVLFLTSDAFNKVTGGGITFANLFAGWPADAIATIHRDPLPLSREVCSQYYRLTEKEIHRWGWLKYVPIGRSNQSDAVPAAGNHKQGALYTLLRLFKTWVFGDGIPQSVVLTPQLEAWISAFQPTVLFTILGSNAMMELAEQLRIRFGLPLVVHIMDDWMSVIYRGGLLSSVQRRKKNRLFRHLMDVADARFAIGADMAAAYKLRYGHPFLAFQNALNVEQLQRYQKNQTAVSTPVRVAYIGSVLPFAQLDSLVECSKAIQSLADDGFAIRLEIYSPMHTAEQYRSQLIVGTAVSLQDSISDDHIFFSTIQAVDILILPVNFDRYSVEFIRYSMPTKVPAYLAVGTPILVYGPAEVAQVAYATRDGWGLTVTDRDMDQLKRAFKRVATDVVLRKKLSERARHTAAKNHDAQTVRSKFQAALSSVVAR